MKIKCAKTFGYANQWEFILAKFSHFTLHTCDVYDLVKAGYVFKVRQYQLNHFVDKNILVDIFPCTYKGGNSK